MRQHEPFLHDVCDGLSAGALAWRSAARAAPCRAAPDPAATTADPFLTHQYRPVAGEISMRDQGSLIAHETGQVTSYAIESAQERGTLFVKPGEQVYEGQVRTLVAADVGPAGELGNRVARAAKVLL